MPTKKTTGIKTMKKTARQVITEAGRAGINLCSFLNRGLKIPAMTMPRSRLAKNGAITFPTRKMDIQNRVRKKKNTAR
jgi:hypothetical protein